DYEKATEAMAQIVRRRAQAEEATPVVAVREEKAPVMAAPKPEEKAPVATVAVEEKVPSPSPPPEPSPPSSADIITPPGRRRLRAPDPGDPPEPGARQKRRAEGGARKRRRA